MAKSPYRDLFVLSCIIAVFIALGQWLYPEILYRYIWILFAFILVISVGSLSLILKLQSNFPRTFLNLYMGIIVGRLFIMAGFAGVFVYFDRPNALPFTISFLILYLLFHGFEIKGIISNLHHQFKKGNGEEQMPR